MIRSDAYYVEAAGGSKSPLAGMSKNRDVFCQGSHGRVFRPVPAKGLFEPPVAGAN